MERLRGRFATLTAAIARRLPFGLSEVVAPSLVGYLMINLCTFFLDVGLLGLFHGKVGLPIPAAVTLSYGTASLVSYTLNRGLNFGSHEAVGRQFPLYVLVSGSNYLIFVLGLTDLLSHLGVYYEFSRVLAACCEAVYLYCMMRWVVFRDTSGGAAATGDAAAGEATLGGTVAVAGDAPVGEALTLADGAPAEGDRIAGDVVAGDEAAGDPAEWR